MAADLPPASLLDRLRDRPARAPEILAVEAVTRLGPPAARWAAEHPREDPRKVVRGAARLGRLEGAATGAAGFAGVVPDLVASGWLQARLVLRIAALHGADPTAPERVPELLHLWGFYDTVDEAAGAVSHEGPSLALRMADRRRGSDQALVKRLARFAGKRAAHRLGGRLVPGLGALFGARQSAAAAREVGERALLFYAGGGSQGR